MKKVIISIACVLVIFTVFAQGNYIQEPDQYYRPLYDNCPEMKGKAPTGDPWYVFSDRENNKIYNAESGSSVIQSVDMGSEFLVIRRQGSRLKVIDAKLVKIAQNLKTWEYNSGVDPTSVLQGWMEMENLLLSQKCLKVCDIQIPSAPKGLFNLQGLFVYAVGGGGTTHKYFTHIPDNYSSTTGKTELNESDRFGFIFKEITVGNTKWFLIGKNDEIPVKTSEIILKGWRPESQVELWKHRLALEYDWLHVNERVQEASRLAIFEKSISSPTSIVNYNNANRVDREYNYFKGVPSRDYYYQRDAGTRFRNVILEENNDFLKVGVLKNSANVPKEIVDPAREIANEVLAKMYRPKVIFVVDGTASIIADVERKSRILETIKNTVESIRDENRGTVIEYEFGASIYRDWGHGQHKFESTDRLTNNVDALNNWMNANLISKGTDNDQPEAVFYGLQKTFEHFGKQIDFFSPTYYVLIGDCGGHNRKDFTNINRSVIKDYLKCNVSDLVAIQYSHRTDRGDNGAAFDEFRTQFRDIFSIYGKEEIVDVPQGKRVNFGNRAGSFLVYPNISEDTNIKINEFDNDALTQVITETLMDINSTLQEKIVHLALMLKGENEQCEEAQNKLREFITTKLINSGYTIVASDGEQIVDWSTRFIVNAARTIKTRNNSSIIDIKIEDYNFFNPGYVHHSYGFLEHSPFQHVVYMNSNNLNKILEFTGRIIALKPKSGKTLQSEIQDAWYYMLIVNLGVLQTQQQVNDLTLSEAMTLLTGFKGNDIYRYGDKEITIGQLGQTGIFTNPLMFRYIFELIITDGYLRSVKNGKWELTPGSLKSKRIIMNNLLRNAKKASIPNRDEEWFENFQSSFAKTDFREIEDYYKGYPAESLDPKYNLKGYWIETNFFSSSGNDFVEVLLNN